MKYVQKVMRIMILKSLYKTKKNIYKKDEL